MKLIAKDDFQVKVVVLASGENVLEFTEGLKKEPTAKLPNVVFNDMLRAVEIFSKDEKLKVMTNHCKWSLANEGNKYLIEKVKQGSLRESEALAPLYPQETRHIQSKRAGRGQS